MATNSPAAEASAKPPAVGMPSPKYVNSQRSKKGILTKVTIRIRLVSGHDLMIQDKKTASSDPYVVFRLGSEKRKSKVINQDLNPVWNEDFDLHTVDTFPHKLKVAVWDRDRGIGNMDDFMGSAEVDLSALGERDECDFSPLQLSTKGHLRLRATKVGEAATHRSQLGGVMTDAASFAANQASSVVGGVQHVALNIGETAFDGGHLATKGISTVGHAAADAAKATARLPGDYLAKKTDALTAAMLERALDSLAGVIKEGLKDPEMPGCMKTTIDRTYDSAWAALREQVKDTVHGGMRLENPKYHAMLSRYRAGAPSFWPKGAKQPQPYTWFRARLLYTLMPSDGTFWTTCRDPVAWGIRLLMVLPVVSVVMMVFLFFAIRKRDEFQLINYITMTRALQAVAVGVVGIIVAGIKFYGCLNQLDESLFSVLPALEDADSHSAHDLLLLQSDAAGNATAATSPSGYAAQLTDAQVDAIFSIRDTCAGVNSAPGYDPISIAIFLVEPFRHACVYLCYYLLLTGYARGGQEHLNALERVRLDAADGVMDGDFDAKRAGELQQIINDDDGDNDPEPVSEDKLWAAGEVERAKLPPRYGMHMKWFAVWDVGVFTFLFLGMSISLYQNNHEWMRWADVFYCNLIYSVLMLPFAALILPLVSTMITDAEPTGYDKSGQIGGMLTPAMMDRKRKFQKRAAKKAARRRKAKNSSSSAAHEDDDNDEEDEPTHSERAAFEAPLMSLRSLF